MSHTSQRIMMISTHGYVGAEPEFGKPDTGGQVVFVLELSRCLARLGYDVDILTRQFEDQPAEEQVDDRVRLLRFPCGGKHFIPKETLCEVIPEWVQRVATFIRDKKSLNTTSSTAIIGTPDWLGRRLPIAFRFLMSIRHTRSVPGSGTTWMAIPMSWNRSTISDAASAKRKWSTTSAICLSPRPQSNATFCSLPRGNTIATTARFA